MQQNKDSRRSFLKHVLAGTAVAAGTALTGKKASAGAGGEKRIQNGQPDEILYSETDNFKKYYESLR